MVSHMLGLLKANQNAKTCVLIEIIVCIVTILRQIHAIASDEKKIRIVVAGFYSFLFWFFLGVLSITQLAVWSIKKPHADFEIESIKSQNLVEMYTETQISPDTLLAHERNLLVFWSPTCKYCKLFFQNKLNYSEIGVFCLPITDDFEYAKYYVEKNEIPYLQICVGDTNGVVPVNIPSIDAVPTFVLLDRHGNVLEQKKGITNIDIFIEKLYN